MIKAVIFDMDGVIIDSEKIHSQSFETVLKEYGKTPIRKKSGVVQTPGIGAHDNWKNLKEEYGLTEKLEILIDKKRNIHQKLLRENLVAMPGLYELLERLKKHKIRIALGSSGHIKNVSFIVKELGIKKYFETIITSNQVARRKPHPDIFLKTAEMLDISPQYCLVLEDSSAGITAAKAAGMKVIAIPTDATKSSDLSQADRIVDSLQSITMETMNAL